MSFSSLRLAVTGLNGQVVSCLMEGAPNDVEIIAIGRPQLEISTRNAVLNSLRHIGCDAIINAAAYTHVDKAESEPEVAMRVNGMGAANVAEAARELQVPLIHLSTDYVFDGKLGRPYREGDKVEPLGVYGRSKLEGENRVRAAHSDHVILRTSWVYSPFGNNFVKTMLKLGRERQEVAVVDDQIGSPTSAIDISDKLIQISRRLVCEPADYLRGTFHLTGSGEASWAEFAQIIFKKATEYGYSPVKVHKISTKDYLTAAARPLNSRLDNAKIKTVFAIEMPSWQSSLDVCLVRLLK